MEVTLSESERIRQEIGIEIQWLDSNTSGAPAGLADELRAMAESRNVTYEAITEQINNTVITIPE